MDSHRNDSRSLQTPCHLYVQQTAIASPRSTDAKHTARPAVRLWPNGGAGPARLDSERTDSLLRERSQHQLSNYEGPQEGLDETRRRSPVTKSGGNEMNRLTFLRRAGGGVLLVAASAALAACTDVPSSRSDARPGAARTSPDAARGREGTTPPGQRAGSPTPPDMVRIDGGSYTVGTNDGPSDEAPRHVVTLAPFFVDRHEVTNAQYIEYLNSLEIEPLRDSDSPDTVKEAFRPDDRPLFIEGAEGAENPRLLVAIDDDHSRILVQGGRFVAAPGYEDHPVAETSWRGARDFAEWRGARLPTEAEWEAAAGGLKGRTFPWGEEPVSQALAVIDTSQPAPVGSLSAGATPEGLMDMAGNLAEWTSSLYRPYPYDPDDGREDPQDPGERVTRGGDAYFSDQSDLRAAARTGFSREPGRGHRHIGFRCAQSA